MSKENVALVIADSWEDADADPVKELMEKVEKVKLLQRKEEKKEAYFEKVKAEEHMAPAPKQAEEGLGPSAEEPKRVFLRRPKDGFSPDSVVESSPSSATSTETQSASRGRSHHKSHQKDSKQPAQTLEERQAAYKEARTRIMGAEYKPDNQEIKEIKFIDRSKSPETLKMTQQNLVEHYGEELSRELMHQPEVPVDVSFLPDFSQPPPNMTHRDNSPIYNGPPGFPQRPPGFQPNYQMQQQQQFLDNQYYVQNGQMSMQYPVHNQMQQFVPQDPSVAGPPKNYGDGNNDQAFYYCPPQQQHMFQNYMSNNLPNMAFPPPNFQPQPQQHQPMNQMNPSQMVPMQQQPQQQTNGQQMVTNLQLKSGVGRGNNGANRGAPNVNGAGRGQNRQPVMFSGGQQNVQGGLYPAQCLPNNTQGYQNRNGGNGQRSMNQQNGQFNQPNISNGRKNTSRNGKAGQNVPRNNSNNCQQQIPVGQNPVPFGCPPRHVTAMREQQASGNMPPNNGAGILGAHPMAQNQWPSLQ